MSRVCQSLRVYEMWQFSTINPPIPKSHRWRHFSQDFLKSHRPSRPTSDNHHTLFALLYQLNTNHDFPPIRIRLFDTVGCRLCQVQRGRPGIPRQEGKRGRVRDSKIVLSGRIVFGANGIHRTKLRCFLRSRRNCICLFYSSLSHSRFRFECFSL